VSRYLEVFFRPPSEVSLPMIVAVGVAVAYESRAPRTYASSATLWCDASLPNVSAVSQGSNYGATTPSPDKEALLEEFLHTQRFDDALAQRTPMGAVLAHQPDFDAARAADTIAGSVTLATPGPQILAIWANAADPASAQGIVQAVVSEFTAELTTTLQQRAQSLVAFDQTQLTSTAATLSSAQGAAAAYLQSHPQDAATFADPRLNLLESQLNAAIQQHSTAESTDNEDGSRSTTSFPRQTSPPSIP